jgi:cytidylate kinase
MIIAIDGPAASGKGTLSRRIAAHYGFPHLDTGRLYRAVARDVLARGASPEDEAAAVSAARALEARAGAGAGLGLDDPALSSFAVGQGSSKVAVFPEVRAALFGLQRKFAATPPGAVLDGRDAGTVICPEADVKIFVTATAEARAWRRFVELLGRGETPDFGSVLRDLLIRDARDQGRAAAPLRPAPDARILDTTHMDAEAAFRAAIALISAQCKSSAP